MKEFKLFFTLCLVLSINYASAQLCTQDNRFSNPEFFSSTQIDSLKNVSYGTALNYMGEPEDLKMDFYFPNNDTDTMAKRPFILLIHGGGFVSGQREDFTYDCKEFAKRGFVAATMSYRLGYDETIEGNIAKGLYRAQQDANAALRYAVANAASLKIDSSLVFLGGSSAGAVTTLYTSYGSQSEWNQALPQLEATLGALKSSGNKLTQTFTIKGIYNHSGSIQPGTLNPEDLIPMISFHGELDKIVPIDKNPDGAIGSRPIHDLLNDAGVCNDLTIAPNDGHIIYYSGEGPDFKINRIACFFKSLICDTCTSFIATEDVPASCPN